MNATPDSIASIVLKRYNELPAKRKPVNRGNGTQEWVPLSGIVAELPGPQTKLECLSLA